MNWTSLMNIRISGQLAVALTLTFGLSTIAYGRDQTPDVSTFKASYKADQCECLGTFSDDDVIFLSTMEEGISIYGKGQTLKEATADARRMCLDIYPAVAQASQNKSPVSITESGCTLQKSTPDGEWVVI